MKILLLFVCCVAAELACASPATQPATRPASVKLVFLKLGGFAGVQQETLLASEDVKTDEDPTPVIRISGEQALKIDDVVRAEKFMTWKSHSSGPDTWNDNFHYQLDITVNGEAHTVHVPADDSTQKEVERLLELMKKIRAIAGVKPE